MNNALIQEEVEKTDSQEIFKAKLTRIVEAIDGLLRNKDWQELNKLIFSEEEARIKRLLLVEAQKKEIDERTIYRLQGELIWAKRYADLAKFAKLLKYQLDSFKKDGK